MATETNITWSSSASTTVSSATEVVSDTFTLDNTYLGFDLQLSADNASTAASGDTAIFRIRWTSGDILGDTGDDFDTSEHAEYVCTLDTYAINTPGENPARKTISFGRRGAVKFQVAVTCANAGNRNIVVRARVVEARSGDF